MKKIKRASKQTVLKKLNQLINDIDTFTTEERKYVLMFINIIYECRDEGFFRKNEQL